MAVIQSKKTFADKFGQSPLCIDLLRLPHLQTGGSSTRPQGIDDFIGFQNMFLSMNHQNPAAEWSAFNPKDIPCSEWVLP
jgi:hypothetical protein